MPRRIQKPDGKELRSSRNREYPDPPETYEAFARQFPDLARTWDALGKAGDRGPLNRKTARLIRLAIAVGAMREGAVHASTRKALSIGITRQQIEQVVSLAAGTLGFPSTVAVFSWIREELERDPSKPRTRRSI